MRIAAVSPFLDRHHGTELCLIEQLERLAYQHQCLIDLYAQQVESLRLSSNENELGNVTNGIVWHRVSEIPGPHLIKYCWWYLANTVERKRASCVPDVVFSPGINCPDADAILVHIVFHDFHARVKGQLRLSQVPLRQWPLTIHRRLYYRLIRLLERRIYTNKRIRLAAVSKWVAEQLHTYFGRNDVTIIPNAVDIQRFSQEKRLARRQDSRSRFGLREQDIVLLLIGNDWKKKGLDQLLGAMAQLRDLPLRLLVAGRDNKLLYAATLKELALEDRVQFLEPSPDVLAFYAAADIYAGPSLEDAFGLPIIEAMACGLPTIASARAGASELIEDGVTGVILKEPMEIRELARAIRDLALSSELRQKIGAAGSLYVEGNSSWERNAKLLYDFLLGSRSVT